MKYFLIFFTILTLLLLGTSLILKLITLTPAYEEEILPMPLTHKRHEHEHEGLACCPCGGCHKHEEGEKHLMEEPSLLDRILTVLLSICVILTY
jgi:hypothetical protein